MKLPAVMILAGSEEFLRDREKQRTIKAAWSAGYRVIYPVNQAEADDEISQAEILSIEPLLLISTWVPDLTSPVPSNVSRLVVLDGDKLPDGITSSKTVKTAVYSRGATRRDRKQAAERFCLQEAKRAGLTVSENLAEAIVGLTGDDLGIVAWEIYKLSAYARSLNVFDVTKDMVQQTIRAATTMPEMSALVEAMGNRDAIRVGRLLARFTGAEDPTMLLLRAKGGPLDTVVFWLRVAEAGGSSPEDLAGMLGAPVWQVKNRDLPAVKHWGRGRLRRLLKALTDLERQILDGRVVSPWIACQTVLLSSMRS